MSKKEKRLEKFARSPHDVPFEQLKSLLESEGFVEQSVAGSHHIFMHERLEENLSIKYSGKLRPRYVKMALSAIDEVRELVGDDDVNA